MTPPYALLQADAAARFLQDGPMQIFDPETAYHVATVHYRPDGLCEAVFADGTGDTGRWGHTQTGYWTQYATFRGGARHAFLLMQVAPDVAQAYHADGARAFVQTPLKTLPKYSLSNIPNALEGDDAL